MNSFYFRIPAYLCISLAFSCDAANFSLITTSIAVCASNDEGIISPQSKSNIETEIRNLINENKESTPSVAITVFDDKQDICSVIYGKSDIEYDITADENTVYEWGSVSNVLI